MLQTETVYRVQNRNGFRLDPKSVHVALNRRHAGGETTGFRIARLHLSPDTLVVTTRSRQGSPVEALNSITPVFHLDTMPQFVG
jgi:hypothetical protein